jgi:hypothetical protein
MISLDWASSDVQVQMSPAPSGAALANLTFFCFAYEKAQISSHCTAVDGTFRTFVSWKAAQAIPASMSSFETVLMDTPVIRDTERMDDPSQSIERI